MNPAGLAGRPVIVGGGIAGLMTALYLAPEPVVLLTGAGLGAQSSSELAQGGLAAALGADDAPALHLADTLAAGDGLCDAAVARQITQAAPGAIEALARFGVRFDRRADGSPRLGFEAAHGRRRIVHAAGDGTGREIVHALARAVQAAPSITVLKHFQARRLLVRDDAVCGVLAEGPGGSMVALASSRMVIATGGIGGLFRDTTNPLACWGQGLMLAARAGAYLADLEFIQFHPTALDGSSRPMRLVSEAVRGEGAVLVDETGRRFLNGMPGAELAPRDVVARAVAAHLAKGHRVFLDARVSPGDAFPDRFPAIAAFCRAAGIDPVRDPIPVRPAAHYHMGGIAVDGEGRGTVEGLWACGEVACTGLHGANRLASNSLIEAAVFARVVARSVSGTAAGACRRPAGFTMPHVASVAAVRPVVSRVLGVQRDGETLLGAIATLLPSVRDDDAAALVLMAAVAAFQRRESRGAHCRIDFPEKDPVARHARLTLRDAVAAAHELAPKPASLARSA